VTEIDILQLTSLSAGIPLAISSLEGEDQEIFARRRRVEQALTRAAAYYSQRLLTDPKAGAARGRLN